jgi:hypothetical protein
MQRTRMLRYVLFGSLFFLVLIGLVSRSYPLLAGLAVLSIVLGVIAEKLENQPTEPFKKYNALHHHQTKP